MFLPVAVFGNSLINSAFICSHIRLFVNNEFFPLDKSSYEIKKLLSQEENLRTPFLKKRIVRRDDRY